MDGLCVVDAGPAEQDDHEDFEQLLVCQDLHAASFEAVCVVPYAGAFHLDQKGLQQAVVAGEVVPPNVLADDAHVLYLFDQVFQEGVEGAAALGEPHLPPILPQRVFEFVRALLVLHWVGLRKWPQEVVFPIEQVVVEVVVDS